MTSEPQRSWWDDPIEPEPPPAAEAPPPVAAEHAPVPAERRLTDDEACTAMEQAFERLRTKRGL